MNVIYISISTLPHMSKHSISVDLLREFVRGGHSVYVLASLEKKYNKETTLSEEAGCHVLRVKIGNNKKANLIEKGITNLRLPNQYIHALKTYWADVKFDLILYPTPPVTHFNTVSFLKKRDGANTYLLLKDIFPQNAVDVGVMANSGPKGLLYRYFRKVEKKLYAVSDYIGCMSQANVDYVLEHNPELEPTKVEICPNCVEVIDRSVDAQTRKSIREKYGIPLDKKVFIYGGNLGKPQGISFLIDCLRSQKDKTDCYFLTVGDGTEYRKLEAFMDQEKPANARLMKRLPKEDYDAMVGACDVGLIFLDHRFTIPNFPSRSLAYMQARIPVLAVTDPNTDIGKVIVDGGFGWWCESNNVNEVGRVIDAIIKEDLNKMGNNGFEYLMNNYTVEKQYHIIMEHFQ